MTWPAIFARPSAKAAVQESKQSKKDKKKAAKEADKKKESMVKSIPGPKLGNLSNGGGGGGGGTNTSSSPAVQSAHASPGHGAFPHANGIVNGTGPGGGGGGGRGGFDAKPVAAAAVQGGFKPVGAIGAIGGEISRPSTAPLPMAVGPG